jgi:hypothetical protein
VVNVDGVRGRLAPRGSAPRACARSTATLEDLARASRTAAGAEARGDAVVVWLLKASLIYGGVLTLGRGHDAGRAQGLGLDPVAHRPEPRRALRACSSRSPTA